LAGLVGISLFSRIERSRLMDNPARACIHEAITQEPGLSLTELAQRAGIAWGTAVHHLRRLEANGLIVSKHLGQRRYFIANSPAAAQRSAVAVVMHPTARRIAHLVSQQPGIDQTGICAALHLNNPAASKHLGHFEEQGLVLSVRTGRNRTYHPTGGLHSALRLIDPAPASASAAAHPLLVAPQVGAW
jgi:predicted transcriptional regulator